MWSEQQHNCHNSKPCMKMSSTATTRAIPKELVLFTEKMIKSWRIKGGKEKKLNCIMLLNYHDELLKHKSKRLLSLGQQTEILPITWNTEPTSQLINSSTCSISWSNKYRCLLPLWSCSFFQYIDILIWSKEINNIYKKKLSPSMVWPRIWLQ